MITLHSSVKPNRQPQLFSVKKEPCSSSKTPLAVPVSVTTTMMSSAHLSPIKVPTSQTCALQKVTVMSHGNLLTLIGHNETAVAQKSHRNEAMKDASALQNDSLVDTG